MVIFRSMERCTPKNSFPIIYIKGKWCNSVVIKINWGKGIFFETHAFWIHLRVIVVYVVVCLCDISKQVEIIKMFDV